jgi:hypothetical protein
MNFKPQTAEFTPAKLTMYAVICSLHNIICLEFREISFGQLQNVRHDGTTNSKGNTKFVTSTPENVNIF